MRRDSLMDVPSPIDFSRIDEAQAWADAANIKRPWRAEFFAAIVSELRDLRTPSLSVLELGSGPGVLAEAVVRDMPDVRYSLLDSSPAMHGLASARLRMAAGAQFLTADFKRGDWADALGTFDAVVTMQAVHELRHKRHAVGLHRIVRTVLQPQGLYLVCDHTAGADVMADTELYMTSREQSEALLAAGFGEVSAILEKNGLVLHRALRAA
jgi:cyclopropane fatty-acyl-phospholipid synthase-like methyltransferase